MHMTTNLTDEMRQALAEHPNRPLHLVDATTQKSYVLLPTGIYQKVEPLLFDDSEPNPDEFLPLAQEVLADDWNAPGMEAYDDYDRRRQQS